MFITGYNETEIEKRALDLGAVDFITKPFIPDICRLRVRNQLKLQVQHRVIERGREQLQKLVRQVPVLITYWDTDWNQIFSNDYNGSWFNFSIASEDAISIDGLFPTVLSNAIKTNVSNDGSEQQFTIDIETSNEISSYQVFQSVLLSDNNVEGHLVTIINISEAKRAKKELRAEKELLRVTLNSIGDAVIATDVHGNVSFMNPIAERMTGWLYKEAKNLKIEHIMSLQSSESKEPHVNPIYIALKEHRIVGMALSSELKNRHGVEHPVEDSAAPIRNENGEVIGAIIVFHDVSETMAMASKMNYLANHDQLTGLPNRILLQDRITVACSASKEYGFQTCLLLIDIDHFKYLNDSLGHQIGDELISLIAKRFELLLPDSYTLSRIGGDEFVVLMNEIISVKSASLLASKLLETMHEQFYLAGQLYNVSVSLGISVYPNDAKNAEELMRHADVAMYRAKQEGRNRFCFFSSEIENALLHRHELEILLRKALKRDELVVHYQPKFDMLTKRTVGAEALVRLIDGSGALVSPAQFIPLAEEAGLIIDLGKQVLFKACAVAKILVDKGLSIPISVNVAAAQFGSPDLVEYVRKALKDHSLPAELLELEITETALMVDASLTQIKLKELKALGIKISIDDFGTGYSSLSYLQKFDVDIMKIDMSFVRYMAANKHDYEIVRTIISLGKSMSLKLVAEGVETEDQMSALQGLGCDLGQGYLHSKPIAEDKFFHFL